MIVAMKTRYLLRCCTLAPLLAAALSASAAPPGGACVPTWSEGWIRLPADPAMGMAAGFGRFHNGCPGAAAVVAAASPAFGDVSLHESRTVGGVNRMRETARLALPAGTDVPLAPGGLHLMLMQPAQPLHEGARVPVTFTLEDGREVRAELQVRKRAP